MTNASFEQEMRMENSSLIIRDYKESDREALRDILKNEASYTQKQKGRASEGKKECLCYMYSDYYFDKEPDNVIVAEVNGVPCGFIVGSTNTKLFQKEMKENYIPKIMKISNVWGFFHKICISVNKTQDLVGGVAFHININHDHQGKKIGTKLMSKMAEKMKEKGKRFLYLVTESKKTAGYKFYSRLGFKVAKSYLGGSVMMIKEFGGGF